MAVMATSVLSLGQAGLFPASAASAPAVHVIDQFAWIEPVFFGIRAVHIVGVVRNDTADNATQIWISVNLKDSNGNSLATDSTASSLEVLAPGEVSPFEDVILPLPTSYSTYSITGVTFARATSSPYHASLPVTLIGCPSGAPPQQVCGTVTNTGAIHVDHVRAVLTFLDGTGAIVAQNSVFVDPFGGLAAGQTGGFSVNRTGEPAYASAVAVAEPDYAVDLNPDRFDFGAQSVGTTSAPQWTTLTNQGGRAMAIQSVAASGDFQADASDCPSSLAPSASCSVVLRFIPSGIGTITGFLTIVDAAAGSPESIPLSGIGVAPLVRLVASGGPDFGDVNVGQSSAPKPITLTNVGNAPLAVSGIATTGDFWRMQTSACLGLLAPTQSCVIQVVFTPGVPGTRNGSLTLTDNAPNSPQQLALNGVGIGPALTFSRSRLDFSDQNVLVNDMTVTIMNNGTADLTITNVSTEGPFVASACAPLPLTLAPRGTCVITVTFLFNSVMTRGPGVVVGLLRITDNAGDQYLLLRANPVAARGPTSSGGTGSGRSTQPPRPPRTS